MLWWVSFIGLVVMICFRFSCACVVLDLVVFWKFVDCYDTFGLELVWVALVWVGLCCVCLDILGICLFCCFDLFWVFIYMLTLRLLGVFVLVCLDLIWVCLGLAGLLVDCLCASAFLCCFLFLGLLFTFALLFDCGICLLFVGFGVYLRYFRCYGFGFWLACDSCCFVVYLLWVTVDFFFLCLGWVCFDDFVLVGVVL